ncbi:hypothetical protein MUG84_03130 [Paenibacillus sp. KQZ6P-2]|uniref:Uncharacterized protein n=1 Tax=Paenibacillus mangrovi TaxID=2931978 RepID=A0A9X1WJZ6_9BACL|nr:hypothetical protein [Paenibacillus mangrovi]MCJ8010737.1 hypothetical protein [Paenibacillus mangrovi]
METTSPESGQLPSDADLIAWQALLRHETLQMIKSGTFLQLVHCPELSDLLMHSIAMNNEMLQLLHQRLRTRIP